jgi:hypothetical protein
MTKKKSTMTVWEQKFSGYDKSVTNPVVTVEKGVTCITQKMDRLERGGKESER